MSERTWRRGAGWAFALAAGAAAAAWAVRDVPAALGSAPRGVRLDRMRRSPHFRDGVFHNPEHTRTILPDAGGSTVRELLFGGQRRKPVGFVPVIDPTDAPAPSDNRLQVLWYGHASTLVEIGGRRVLLDPVWSDRCSPSRLIGPKRLHPIPVPLSRVPAVDAIVISHDHYDHLDMPTVRALARTQSAPFVVPLGVGSHLDRWGVPPARIIELDWEESTTVAGVRLTATCARHFSGRASTRNNTLWSSWVLAAGGRSVFYTGDSGYFDGYATIGAKHGPFDAALVQIGAYSPAWPEIHMTPEEAVSAHLALRGGLFIPVHWATFILAFHAWGEPADRVWREAKARDVKLAVPRPGEVVDVDDPPIVDGWWQTL